MSLDRSLESIVRRDRAVTAAGLGALTLLAWLYLVRLHDETADMADMGMAIEAWTLHDALTAVVMWAVMMIAMMLPSVMPAVLLHRRVIQARLERGVRHSGSDVLLLAGYFSVWVAFGAVAYAIGMTLATAAMRSIRVSVLVPAATGVALAAAGGYQLTPWKQSCLRHCRSPLDFFVRHEIRRASDSWRFGVHHGAYCAACCWGLMVIQLVLGVMSVPLMALVALVILLEKQWRHGNLLARVVGAASVAAGIFIALRATIRG